MSVTLSVVIANYNHGHLIDHALEAILAQSRLPDEILILDDGSTDDSVSVIERFLGRSHLVRLIRHQSNMGGAAAGLRLFAEAKGEFVYAAGADDQVLPGFFENAMGLVDRNPGVGVVFGRWVAVDAEGRTVHRFDAPAWSEPTVVSPKRFAQEHLARMPAGHSLSAATIYRLAAYRDLGGLRPELGPWADTFLINALALRYGCCFVPLECAACRVNPSTFSGAFMRNLEAVDRVVESASRLMLQPPFAELFPAAYSDRWAYEFRLAIARQRLWDIQVDLRRRRALASERAAPWGPAARPIALGLDYLLRFRARRAHGKLTRKLARLGWPKAD